MSASLLQLFCEARRAATKDSNPSASAKEMMQLLAGAWNAADTEERAEFVAKHQVLLRMLPQLKATLADFSKELLVQELKQEAEAKKADTAPEEDQPDEEGPPAKKKHRKEAKVQPGGMPNL